MAAENKRRARRAGTTLVELIVSMLLIEILAAMVIGVLGPASAAFAKLQRTITAQSVIDNISEEIAKILEDVTGNVCIYKAASGATSADPLTGAYVTGTEGDAGTLLEYVNPDGYVELLSADGCGATDIYLGANKTGGADEVSAGRLLLRYYAQNSNASGTNDGAYTYIYQSADCTLRARSVNPVFTDKYYLGSYLAVTFAYPAGQESGKAVQYLTVTISLYKDADRTDLLTSETTTVQLRYSAKCYFPGDTGVETRTAITGSTSEE